MLDFIRHNKILVVVLGLIVGAGAWYGLSGSSSPNTLLVTEPLSGSENAAEKDLVATLLQLRSVSLEGTIFGDPSFLSLQDFGSQIVPEPVGRPNPFAPLSISNPTSPDSPGTKPSKPPAKKKP